MNCKYKVNIKDIQYNYKVKMEEIQSKYKFNIFCRGYDDSDIKGKINDMYNAWPKVTGEGEEITLNDTVNASMPLGLKGNTYQDSTTGKNLFSGWEKGKGISSTNGAIFISSNGAISDYIPVNFTTNQNYYVSGFTSTLSSFVGAYNSNKEFLGRTAGSARTSIGLNSRSFTSGTPQGTGDIAYIMIYQYKQTSDSGTIDDIDNMQTQIEVGSSPTSYEPYTGGNPAPNPDFPMPVHVVSGDNEVEVRGKNLQSAEQLYQRMYDYDANYVSKTTDGSINVISFNNSRYRNDIEPPFTIYNKWKENTQYTIRGLFKNSESSSGSLFFRIKYTDNTVSQLSINSTVYTELRIVSTANKTIDTVGFSFGQSRNYYLDMSSWFIGEGNVTEYPEYKGTTYPINLPEGMFLANIPNTDYQDYFYKQDKKWYLKKEVGKYRLPNNTGGYNQSANWYYFGFSNLNIDILKTTMFCKYFWYREYISTQYVAIGYSSNFTNLLIRNPNLTSTEAYRTWLGDNEVYIYYVLNTPINTEITDPTLISQLDALLEAESYSGQTNITQTNEDMPFIITASTLKDLSNL